MTDRNPFPAASGRHVSSRAATGLICLLLTSSTLPAQGEEASPETADGIILEAVYYDSPDEEGRLSGGIVYLPSPDPTENVAVVPASTSVLVANGDPANRVDLVFVGDGYTASELDDYAREVDELQQAYFSREPFVTYAPLFNTHRVDVISNESGVDNDPTRGITRDTELDMQFWCSNIERLLCVDTQLAASFAANAPDVDQIAAIANASKYGGAGYAAAKIATASSRNSLAPEVLLHEFGHSLGNLADEYHNGDGREYTGSELNSANLSILDHSGMSIAGTKWANWLDVDDPLFDGRVSAFEGGGYHQYGIYRPTRNSMMRSLQRPFNLPSVEALIINIYKIVSPIDAASATSVTYAGTETLFVDPVDPVGHKLDVQWFYDGLPIFGANDLTLNLGTLALSAGPHVVTVTVVDNTDWVRDEEARSLWMTDARNFDVLVSGECSLDASFADGILDLEFGIGTRTEAIWDVWMYFGGSFILLSSIPLPVIDPPITLPFSGPFPAGIGTIILITTLSTVEEGTFCFDYALVHTGG